MFIINVGIGNHQKLFKVLIFKVLYVYDFDDYCIEINILLEYSVTGYTGY